MARKTLPVRTILEKANNMLANSADELEDARRGVCCLIETLLFEADCYRGFSYLPSAGLKGGGSEYRRKYLISSKLGE